MRVRPEAKMSCGEESRDIASGVRWIASGVRRIASGGRQIPFFF